MTPKTSGRSQKRAWADGAEGILLWIFTMMLLADVLLGIAARYVDFEIVFADELGKYLFIWLCLLGISAATRDNQHVRMNFIASRLPLRPRLIALISQSLFLAFTLFYFYWTARLTWMHLSMGKSAMGFTFPMHYFTAALPFGFGLTSIRLIQDIVRLLKGHREARNGTDEYAVKEL